MKFLTAIVTVSLVIMITASAGYYFYNSSVNNSSYPSYHVDMHLNTTIPVPYYPIHVNSNLTGNGTYQQLLTFSDPSHYGINANGSNLAFYDGSNNTHLYAWIQSMNNTSMQIWVKNFNGSSTINMQVLPSFENLFSATGYLGEAPQLSPIYGEYFNLPLVTPYATDFQSYSEFKGYIDNVTGNVVINNGLNVTQGYVSGATNMGITLGYAPTTRDVLYTYIANYYLFGGSGNRNNNPQGFGWSQDGGTYYIRYQQGLTGNPYYGINEFGSGEYDTSISNNGGTSVPSIGLSSIYFNATNYVLTTSPSGYQNYEVSPSTTVNSSEPAYAEIGNWNNADNTTMVVYYSFIATPPNAQDIMPTFTIGAFTNMTDHVDVSYLSNSITIPMPNWFNLTLKAYTNYSFTFQYNNTPLYFTYDGLINNTIYTGFFDHNLTLDIHFIALGYSGKTQSIVLERG